MNKRKMISAFLFYGSVAFLTGLFFLFFINVPVEKFLAEQSLDQKMIDFIMTMLIVVWFLGTVAITVYYYRGVITSRRKRTFNILCIGLMLSASIFVFYLIITQNPIMHAFQNKEAIETDRFLFWHYPNESKLK